MPDGQAVRMNVEGGFQLTAAGIRRQRDGALTADVVLSNGQPLWQDRVTLNTPDGRAEAAAKAAGGESRPSAEAIAQALLTLLEPSLAQVQESSAPRASQADDLVALANDVELFHDPDGEAYASVPVAGHVETYRVRARPFREWLEHRFYASKGKSPNAQALQDALGVLSGRARFEGAEHGVFTRIAALGDHIVLDLGDAEWRAVEVTAEGWRVLAQSPVKYRRPKGVLPLPFPVSGGDLGRLRAFLNVEPDQWVLVLGWLLASLAPGGPYPVLILTAEQGSGKSTVARLLRALFDPNEAPLRSEPRDNRDLMIAARNGAVVALDNLSRLSRGESDDLCRLATGGGLSTRTLYTNDDETLFSETRPVLLTGIEDLADRGDLLDRAILVGCPTIRPEARRTERELWEAFEAERPALLGALLDAVAEGLRNLPTTKLPALPRMADATLWITACEPAVGLAKGTFARAYAENRRGANDLALDVSPVPAEVRAVLAANKGEWHGSASELLEALDARASDGTKRLRAWPKSAQSLGNLLRRIAPNLREAGVDVNFESEGRGAKKRRVIRIAYFPVGPSGPADPTAREVCQARDIHGDDTGDAESSTWLSVDPKPSPPEGESPAQKPRPGDNGDNGDGAIPHQSGRAPQNKWDEAL